MTTEDADDEAEQEVPAPTQDAEDEADEEEAQDCANNEKTKISTGRWTDRNLLFLPKPRLAKTSPVGTPTETSTDSDSGSESALGSILLPKAKNTAKRQKLSR